MLDVAGRYQVTRALSPGARGPATQTRSIPRSLSLQYPATPASPNALHLLLSSRSTLIEFRFGSSGLVLPNLCSNGHIVFTCSTQNRMTFPRIPPTAPFDGVGGEALHTRRPKVLDSNRLLGGSPSECDVLHVAAARGECGWVLETRCWPRAPRCLGGQHGARAGIDTGRRMLQLQSVRDASSHCSSFLCIFFFFFLFLVFFLTGTHARALLVLATLSLIFPFHFFFFFF